MKRWFVLAAVGFLSLVGAVIATIYQPSPDDRPCSAYEHGQQARECYVKMLSPDTPVGIPAMFREVDRLLADPDAGMHFAIECHEVLHDLGKILDEAIGPLDMAAMPAESCATGFQHGIAEHRLATLSDAALQSTGPAWCAGQNPPVCLHILGHVAMRRTLAVSNTPDPAYVGATCASTDPAARASRDRAARLDEFRCLDGAYMEWALWAMRTDDSSVPYPPEQACIDLHGTSKIMASACFSQVGALMLGQYETSLAALEACQNSISGTSTAAVRLCVFSVINSIVSLSENPIAEAARYCTGTLAADCFVGFARSIAANLGDESVQTSCEAMVKETAAACIEAANGPYPFEF